MLSGSSTRLPLDPHTHLPTFRHMPIIELDGQPTVVCVSHEYPTHQAKCTETGQPTTMQKNPDWYCLPMLEPASPPRLPAIANKVVPLQVISCSECGYTEIYNGLVTDPARWGVTDRG